MDKELFFGTLIIVAIAGVLITACTFEHLKKQAQIKQGIYYNCRYEVAK